MCVCKWARAWPGEKKRDERSCLASFEGRVEAKEKGTSKEISHFYLLYQNYLFPMKKRVFDLRALICKLILEGLTPFTQV